MTKEIEKYRKLTGEQKKYWLYVLEVAERFRHCEQSEAIPFIRFDKSWKNVIEFAYNMSKVTHMGR